MSDNSKKFDIEMFISEAIEKDRDSLLILCNEKLEWLKGINITPKSYFTKDDEPLIQKYKSFISEVAFLVAQKVKPHAMSKEDFERTKPIAESLILKGELDKDFINNY